MRGTLLAGGKTKRVTREELHVIVPPEPTATWKPIAYGELLTALEAELHQRQMGILKEDFAIQRNGAIFFGVLDLAWNKTAEFAASIGLRTSTNKSLSLQMAIGMRVMVCENLAFSGDLIALKRKHTSGLNLAVELSQALDRYQEGFGRLMNHVDRLKSTFLSDEEAKMMIYRVFEQAIMPVRFFHPVNRCYFSPQTASGEEIQAFSERTLWSLHNAFTHHIKSMAPSPAFQATAKLGKFFGM